MMGSTYPTNSLPGKGGENLLKEVTPILSDADITLGNLEGTLLVGGECTKHIKKGRCYAFRMPPDFGQNLKSAGFDFMNLANNHMNDFGALGIASTIKVLESLNIKYGGPDGKIGQFEIDGKKIAIICFATSLNTNTIFDITNAQRIVASQSRQNDIVIVSFHGGAEGIKALHTRDNYEYFTGLPRGNVVKFARAVVDSGADFVWGHGPHVPRAMEIYKERLIAYSLGNFCTWGFNIDAERGYAPILKLVLDSTGIFKSGKLISAIQRPYHYPVLDPQHRAAKLIKQLSREDFPASSPRFTDDYEILPQY